MIDNRLYKKIQQVVGKAHCSRDREDLVCYAYDATAQVYLPDIVVFPKTVDEISELVRLANENRFFVIPRGGGSGATGGSLATRGGMVLVTTRMNRILRIDTDNLVAHAQPGVITSHLHGEVEKVGLYYPPDPSSSEFSTLGGNLAECAGGPRAVKYGVTRDYVLGIQAVTGTGTVIETGVQTVKGVVGYDLTRLLVGSEGTLGIITRMALRLLPKPKAIRTMTATFPNMAQAARSVSEIIRNGLIPRTVEFLDQASLVCAENYLHVGLPVTAGALLLIETDGTAEQADQAMDLLSELCRNQGATQIHLAETREAADRLWQARKALSPAMFQYGPDKINEDIVVPRSKIPEMLSKIYEIRDQTGLSIICFGHAGDGNIHVNIMLDKSVSEQLKKAESAVERLFDETLVMGGTISGEHGVGISKRPYISKEIGPIALDLMKQIKSVFDPNGILNPGKIFPDIPRQGS